MPLGRNDLMSTTSRYNRRDFLKAAAPAAIAVTQGIAPAQSGEPQDVQPKYMPDGHGAYFYMQGPFHTDAPPSLGYQLQYTPRDIYRLGIAAADGACKQATGRVFSELPHSEQEQFLTSLEKGNVTLQGPPAATFFDQLLANTREGYFADPMYGGNRGMGGWNMIGFPGARADFTNWMNQPGRAYPYGPTAINGSRS